MPKFIPVDSFEFIIFGATGDLAMRKLLPAMLHRDRDGQFSDDSLIIGVSRSELTSEQYRQRVHEALKHLLGDDELDAELWRRFSHRIHYYSLDINNADSWGSLVDGLAVLTPDTEKKVRVFYLATMPTLFGETAQQIARVGLVSDDSRIVIEKPLGHDLPSAKAINNKIRGVFAEHQIYRIDHYLGKETVQNLSALRFANALFEPQWNRAYIDHVQITVAEKLGVGSRGSYYDRAGALRDMLQNHILQLLCLVAMEPPMSQHHDDIRNEKLKILKSLKPISIKNVKSVTARGQYQSGAIDNELVPSFQEDLQRDDPSNTETFVAIKAEIDNWRWSGTPFYLRTGKRMASKCSEIVVQFKDVAHNIFGKEAGELTANRLTIKLQPDEGVQLSIMTKQPGPGGFQLRSVPLNLSFSETFQLRYPDAYERLLMEVFRGNPALFMRGDEVEAAWGWIDNIIAAWQETNMPAEPYAAGGWGPKNALLMLDRDGREWQDTLANETK